MERTRVKSSDIASVGYDRGARILEVEFVRGSVYQYVNVGENVYNELMSADSLGNYFNTHIRDQYQNTKV